MQTMDTWLAILTGVLVRLAIPILITVLGVYFLRKLDSLWQAAGEELPSKVKKPECWKTMGCTPAQRKKCPGFASPAPCWQARRLPNGYLLEVCLDCPVFRAAPAVFQPQ